MRNLLLILITLLVATLLTAGPALLLRLPPLRSVTQNVPSLRRLFALGAAAISFLSTIAGVVVVSASLVYGLGEFYFETTLGSVPGVTQANVESYRGAVVAEVWIHYWIGGEQGSNCLSADATVCQLTEATERLGTLHSIDVVFLVIATVMAVISYALAMLFTRPPDRYRARPLITELGE